MTPEDLETISNMLDARFEAQRQQTQQLLHSEVKPLNATIEAVEARLAKKIETVDMKIEAVEARLSKKIETVDMKVEAINISLGNQIGTLRNKIDSAEQKQDAAYKGIEDMFLRIHDRMEAEATSTKKKFEEIDRRLAAATH